MSDPLTTVVEKHARKVLGGKALHFYLPGHDKSVCGIKGDNLHEVEPTELLKLELCNMCFPEWKEAKVPDFDQEDIAYEDKVVDTHESS